MKKRIVTILTGILLLASSLIIVFPVEAIKVSGNTLYVGGSGLGNYTRIQDAIDNATDGDTIFVYDYSSPYSEHLIINKEIRLIGEEKNTTKIFGTGGQSHLILILSDYVTLSNFTIQYGSTSYTGIYIRDSSWVVIMDCLFSDIPSMDAITVSNTTNIKISNCIMTDTFTKSSSKYIQKDRYISGITLEGNCVNTTIMGNTISETSYAGIIILKDCLNTQIINNYIFSNDLYGIRAQYCNSTIIANNVINDNNQGGIALMNCNNTAVFENTIDEKGYMGIGFGDSANTQIISNNIVGYVFATFTCNYGLELKDLIFSNKWDGNYWGRSRILPKPIFGLISIYKLTSSPIIILPWLMVDWHPAKEPYDIP